MVSITVVVTLPVQLLALPAMAFEILLTAIPVPMPVVPATTMETLIG
jgi:hypothetical protein